MRIILLGGPGVGKGTQAHYIGDELGIPVISVGEMLRLEIKKGTALGLRVKEAIESGSLAPDEVSIALVRERITHSDCKNGYLLDGFPRTITQAEALSESKIHIDYVIEISVSDDVVVERVSGRLIHISSGRTYHTKYNPPKVDGVDDLTGEPLVQRADDSEDAVRQRLQVYHEKTEPLIKYYHNIATDESDNKLRYIRVDGTGTIDQVHNQILRFIGKA